jgi:hypothetical protein
MNEGERTMFSITRRFAGAAAVAAAIAVPGANVAAQIAVQDGLVNVSVGDVTILEDVNVGVAAAVAANVCGLKVGPVAVLGQAVDRSGSPTTVCTSSNGPVVISQN